MDKTERTRTGQTCPFKGLILLTVAVCCQLAVAKDSNRGSKPPQPDPEPGLRTYAVTGEISARGELLGSLLSLSDDAIIDIDTARTLVKVSPGDLDRFLDILQENGLLAEPMDPSENHLLSQEVWTKNPRRRVILKTTGSQLLPAGLQPPRGVSEAANLEAAVQSTCAGFPEGFEGTVWYPSGQWLHFQDNLGNGNGSYFWQDRTCSPYAGSWSGNAILGGALGGSLGCNSNYPNGLTCGTNSSWLQYAYWITCAQGASTANLEFFLQLNTETGFDFLRVWAWVEGSSFLQGHSFSGPAGAVWQQISLNLKTWPVFGDLTAYPRFALYFEFCSDGSVNYPFGVRVDNITVNYTLPPPPAPTITSPGSDTGPGPDVFTTTPSFYWSAVPTATQYGLYISKFPYGSTNLIYCNTSLTGTSYTLSPGGSCAPGYLWDGERYRWNMTAFNSAGESGVSNTLYFKIPPNAPSGLQAIGSGGAVLLGWADNSANETGFNIERSLGTSGPYGFLGQASAGSTAFQDNTVSFGNVYCYRIYATSGAGNSTYSSEDCGTALAPPVLTDPANGASVSNPVTLAWNSVTEAEIYGVDLGVSACGDTSILSDSATTGTTMEAPPLQPGTYYWRVRAFSSEPYPGASEEAPCRSFTVICGTEICDGLDNDCDGTPDDGCEDDGDGFCDADFTLIGTPAVCPLGPGDCDDSRSSVRPGAAELCDGLDNDCDRFLPSNERDNDSDGVRECSGDCDDLNSARFPGNTEMCDGIDNDCDNVVPPNEADSDADGFRVCQGDCQDTIFEINPAAEEVPGNTVDENCDQRFTQPDNTVQGFVQFEDGSPVPSSRVAVTALPYPSMSPSTPCEASQLPTGETSFWCHLPSPGTYMFVANFKPVSSLTPDPNQASLYHPWVDAKSPPLTVEVIVERVTITFPNPVVLVHGWRASDLETWATMREHLHTFGFPVFIVNSFGQPTPAANGLKPCGTYDENVAYLQAYLNAKVVTNLQVPSRPLPKISFLAHSMGGLITRQYLTSAAASGSPYNPARITRVIELGTPNAGTVQADALIGQVVCNADQLLGRVPVYRINLANRDPMGVPYFYIAGEDNGNQAGCTFWSPGQEPDPEDGWVAEQSVFHRRVQTNVGSNTRRFPTETLNPIDGAHLCIPWANHCELHEDLAARGIVADILLGNTPAGHLDPLCAIDRTAAAVGVTLQTTDYVDSEVIRTAGGTLTDGQTLANSFAVDTTPTLTITGVADTGSGRLVALRPDGQEINPENAGSFPDVTYTPEAPGPFGAMSSYIIQNPQTGIWQVSLMADLSGIGGTAAAFIESRAETARRLTPVAGLFHTRRGEAGIVSATLEDGPLSLPGGTLSATVTRPSGSTDVVTLLDDGGPPDIAAGDGTYTGTVTDSSEVGSYNLTFRGAATIGTETFEREASAMLDVATGNATIGLVLPETTTDPDSDGAYDALEVTFEVSVTAAPMSFRLTASLVDATNVLIAQDTVEIDANAPGTVVATVRFEGAAISHHGVDGPFRVTDVLLTSGGELLLQEDSRQDALTTQTYAASAFEGRDTDGDGVPDAADNCPDTFNPGGTDADGDGVGDSCDTDLDGDGVGTPSDCSDYDPTVVSAPPNLMLSLTDSGTLSWSNASASGPGTLYDVVRGSLASLWASASLISASCHQTGLVSTSLPDTSTPPVGDGLYYLVRARNACGDGQFSGAGGSEPVCP